MDKRTNIPGFAEEAEAALARAQEFARKRAIETGTPFIVCRDGKRVDLNVGTRSFNYEEAPAAEPTVVREEPEED